MLPRLTPKQRQRANALIKRLCANYDNGNCLALDDGEPCACVQSISYSLLCKYFRKAVLPAEPLLEADILGTRFEKCVSYVEVDVTHKTDGTARPRKIKFEDGEVYEIDRVRHRCRAASTKVGGTGLRYTVMICGTETFLFDEENGKWFVEGKKRAVL